MRVNVQTSQNVLIDYELAGLGTRISAFAIDIIVQGGYIFLVYILYDIIFKEVAEWLVFPFLLPYLFYHLISETFLDGQSVGKKQMRIKVIRLDGSQPSFANFIMRWILRFIDMPFYGGVALMSIIVTKQDQRLGDLAAGTTVIRIKKKVILSSKELIKNSIQEDYEPIFQEAEKLSDNDVQIIKEVLDAFRQSGDQKPITMLAEKTKQVLGITTEMPPVKLLYTVLKDYNHILANA